MFISVIITVTDKRFACYRALRDLDELTSVKIICRCLIEIGICQFLRQIFRTLQLFTCSTIEKNDLLMKYIISIIVVM